MSNFEVKYNMRKILLLCLLLSLTGCKEQKPRYYLDNPLMKAKAELAEKEKNKYRNEEILDLTKMSSIMADSYLTRIIDNYSSNEGKKIKIKGTYFPYTDSKTNITYHSCIFQSSCCPKGLEFELKEGIKYPEENQEIYVLGEFSTYQEGQNTFYILKNADLGLPISNKG